MKNYTKILLAVFVFNFLIIGCSSGKKMLEKGNYYQAVMTSIERLRSSPNNNNARETLAEAYPFAVSNLLDKLESKKAAQNSFYNTEAVYVYENLNKMYESIQRSPAAKEVIYNPKKYYTHLNKVKPKAAEEHYRAGIEQLSLDGREYSKQAYFYFQKANKFVPNYKDVNAKIEESYNLSILKVVSDLKPVHSRLYDLSADIFYTEVNKILRQIEQKEFIRFYTPEQIKKLNIDYPEQYLEINFEDFIVGETHTKEWIEDVKSDSVKVSQITLRNGDKRDIYDIVTARVSISRMEVISKGIINLRITNTGFDDQILINQNFAGEYVWFNEWGHFNGDKRALTTEQLEICRIKRVAPIPPQQMFVEFTKPIHSQLRSKLINFYNNY